MRLVIALDAEFRPETMPGRISSQANKAPSAPATELTQLRSDAERSLHVPK